MANTARVQKLITFSPQLYELIFAKARQLGLSFGEYIRHLTIIDIKDQVTPLEFVDTQTEKRIAKGLEDYKNGRYTEIKTAKELDAYLKNL